MVSVTELLHIVTSIGFIGFSFLLTGFKRALNYSSEIEFHTTALQLQLFGMDDLGFLNRLFETDVESTGKKRINNYSNPRWIGVIKGALEDEDLAMLNSSQFGIH
ncbi:hypothetical protein Bca4012_043928 [Brassica carinata]